MDDVLILDTDFVLDNFKTEDLESTSNSSGVMYGKLNDLFYFIVKDNTDGELFKGFAHKDKSLLKHLAISSLIMTITTAKSWESRTELISLKRDLENW